MESQNPYESRPWLSAYAPGVPDVIEEVTETLSDMIEASIARYGSAAALEFFGATTTYHDLGEQIERAAEGLRKLGVSHGDRVAIILPNCPQHVVAFYAVLRLGAIVVEHNPLYTARELRHQFEDHQARFAIAWDKVCDTLAGFPADLTLERIVSVDMTEAMPWTTRIALRLPLAKARTARAQLTATPKAKKVLGWRALVDGRRLNKQHPHPVIDDIALLQYTSGTTGAPKGAILTHSNLRANAMQGRAWVPGLHEGEETFYGVLPLFHTYGMTLCLTFAMSIGAKLVLFPKYDVILMADAAKKSPPTFLPAVPPMFDQLARAAERGTIDLKSLRFAMSGAMSLPVETVARWEEVTGGLLVEGYGMTETSPIVLANPDGPVATPRNCRRAVPEHRHPCRRPRRHEHGSSFRGVGRAAGPWPSGVPGLLAATERDGGDAAPGSLGAHRRHRHGLGRRVRHRRRPAQGDHHHRRFQRRPDGGRRDTPGSP